nr:uncharacterized protein LOC109619111 isoform X2 [Crassostrea gigas]
MAYRYHQSHCRKTNCGVIIQSKLIIQDMALIQAQALSSLVYRKEKTISLGQRLYVFDIDCGRNGNLCISASNNSSDFYNNPNNSDSVIFKSSSGSYIAIQEQNNDHFNFTYGTYHSIKRQSATLTTQRYSTSPKPSGISEDRTKQWVLSSPSILWGEDEDFFHRGCGPKSGFTAHGITATKSGGILFCLWNNEFGERSSGKVISIDGKLQISMDKNQPLYICPTYIAENGNGDICVSDVRAVVVTDAGGMLRFRYQGNSKESNFDPYGICCDSKYNIIVAEMKNDKLLVVDKDGEFLHQVTYDGIKMLRAVCIDENDRVFVGEWDSDAIKVIAR